jgi:hypothetical protein
LLANIHKKQILASGSIKFCQILIDEALNVVIRVYLEIKRNFILFHRVYVYADCLLVDISQIYCMNNRIMGQCYLRI